MTDYSKFELRDSDYSDSMSLWCSDCSSGLYLDVRGVADVLAVADAHWRECHVVANDDCGHGCLTVAAECPVHGPAKVVWP